MSVPREYYFDGCDTGFLDDQGGNMINPRVGHPLYLQVCCYAWESGMDRKKEKEEGDINVF